MKKLLIILTMTISLTAWANDTEVLADAIAEVCNFDSEKITEDEKIDCGVRYANCIIKIGGKWEDKDILNCVKKEGYGGTEFSN